MKSTISFDKLILFVAAIFISLLGVYIGLTTIWKYELIVRGLLGVSTIYLIRLLFSPPKNFFDKPLDIAIRSFTGIKYILVDLVLSIVLCWATYYAVNLAISLARFFSI